MPPRRDPKTGRLLPSDLGFERVGIRLRLRDWRGRFIRPRIARPIIRGWRLGAERLGRGSAARSRDADFVAYHFWKLALTPAPGGGVKRWQIVAARNTIRTLLGETPGQPQRRGR